MHPKICFKFCLIFRIYWCAGNLCVPTAQLCGDARWWPHLPRLGASVLAGCWLPLSYVSSSVYVQVIFVFSLLSYEEMLAGDYIYPEWSINMGWLLTASSISCIPVYIAYKFIITPGSCLKVSVLCILSTLQFSDKYYELDKL